MKDKAKRDKEKMQALEKENAQVWNELSAKDKACRQLLEIAKKSGADNHELYLIVQDDHFLRKCL